MTHLVVVTPGMQGRDGVSVFTRQCVEALLPLTRSGGATLEVWSLADAHRPEWLPSPIAFRGANGSRLTFASFTLISGISGRGALVVVIHLHLLPALLPLMAQGVRVATWLLGVEAWKPLRTLERIALLRSWRVAAISAHTVERFRLANPAMKALRIEVCHPGLGAPLAASSRRLLALPTSSSENAIIVGRMSHDERYKGHDELLDVWTDVQRAVPGAHLTVVGDGDDRVRLEHKRDDLGLATAVTFTGRVSDAAVADLFAQAAMFVMPSRDEGFGLVYVEAMRAGLPCVAAPGAAEEILTNGEHGMIVHGQDCAALAGAIVTLFQNRPLRARMGAAARRRADEYFTAEHFSVRFLDWLGLRELARAC